jgi:hypothetical protein
MSTGKDILVCRLCREIFTDPDKYFDHAHFHVVERLSLAATTNVNLPCKLCEASFNNKYDYYKHCYEAHLEQNLDKLTTTPGKAQIVRFSGRPMSVRALSVRRSKRMWWIKLQTCETV